MTVSSETRRADYLGDGATTDFATEFRFLQNQDLKVIVTVTATGAESEKVLNTDYTVTGAGLDAGGTVAMIVAPSTGEKISILRNVSITQETDYVENDPFPAESHERALDKLTMIVQQQQDDIDRSLKLQESEVSSGLTVPSPDEGKFLQWDADGNLKNTDIAGQGSIAITDFGRDLVVTTDASEARTLLDVNSTEEILSATDPFSIATGSVDALIVDYTPDLDTTIDGRQFRVRTLGPNTATSPTIQIDGASAKTITKNGGLPLQAGNMPIEAVFRRNTINDRVELLNPVQVKESFKSSEQTITSGGLLTLNHGLSGEPAQVMVSIICKTADQNYSVGDVLIMPLGQTAATDQDDLGLSVRKTGTQIIIRYGSDSEALNILRANDGLQASIVNTRWRLIVEASL